MKCARKTRWTRLQRKMAPNICLNAVMQTQQYADPVTAVKEASIIMADGADSVMTMGVTNEALKAMADNNIAVFGHVGCLSGWQTWAFRRYRRVGKRRKTPWTSTVRPMNIRKTAWWA